MSVVLYIEDNNANTELVRRYLGAIDCELIIANDGGSGITSAVDHRPDVILLDIYLPDISGLDVAEQLRAIPELSATPLVALTTDDSIELKNECLAHGFAEVLHKPVRPKHLLSVIEQITA
ncbi:MAG: response regulator [Chloroflexota bacterium]